MSVQAEAVTYEIGTNDEGRLGIFFKSGTLELGRLYVRPTDPFRHPWMLHVYTPMEMRFWVRFLRRKWPAWNNFSARDTLAVLLVARDELIDRGLLEG